jgi:hypothetical protein
MPSGESIEQRQNNFGRAKARVLFMLLGLVFAAFLSIPDARASVAVDAVGPSPAGGGATGGGVSGLSWTHTVSGTSTLLTVAVAVSAASDAGMTLAVTYNGVAMTSASKVHTNNSTTGFIQLFYLVSPASGANTVAVTLTGGTADMVGGSVSFTGVNQGTPVQNTATGFGNGASATVNVASAFGDMVVDAVANGSNITASTKTNRWLFNLNGSNGAGNAAQSTNLGASSVTMGYSLAADNWGIIGMDIVASKGYQVSSRSDTLSNSQPSATSNHTIAFTVNNAIYGSSTSGSSTLTLTLDPAFAIPAAMDCGDVDVATASQFNFNWPACQATATAWGLTVDPPNNFVQEADLDGGNVSQDNLAFASANAGGDLIVAVASWDNQALTITAMTDTAGDTFTSAIGPTNSLSTKRQQIFYAKNVKGGANTVKATLSSAATSSFKLSIFEYSGIDTVSPLDVTSVATAASGTAMDSGAATTNFANELVFGVGFLGGVSQAPGPGFLIRSKFHNNMFEDENVSAAGSYHATETGDGSNWAMYMLTFKVVSSKAPRFTLVPPTDTAVHVATGTQVTIKIGANATFQQQGVHWISNPSSGGVYTIAVGGTFGGSGNMLVQVGIKASSVKMVQVQSGLTGPITVNATGAGNLLVVGITAVQISRSGVAEVVEMGASSRFG